MLKCDKCGRDLIYIEWTSETTIPVCDDPHCERYHQPIHVDKDTGKKEKRDANKERMQKLWERVFTKKKDPEIL